MHDISTVLEYIGVFTILIVGTGYFIIMLKKSE